MVFGLSTRLAVSAYSYSSTPSCFHTLYKTHYYESLTPPSNNKAGFALLWLPWTAFSKTPMTTLLANHSVVSFWRQRYKIVRIERVGTANRGTNLLKWLDIKEIAGYGCCCRDAWMRDVRDGWIRALLNERASLLPSAYSSPNGHLGRKSYWFIR